MEIEFHIYECVNKVNRYKSLTMHDITYTARLLLK